MKSLFLVPLGIVEEDVMKTMEIGLWQIFGFDIQRMPAIPEPGFAYDPQRKQFSSALILRELVKMQNKNTIRILGVTSCDLFIPMLSFVFGHAQLNGSAAVISLARLHQEFYHLPENADLFLSRCLKEAVHEVGHTFGLIHCSNPVCAMSLSNAIHTVDTKSEELCSTCSIILEENIKQLFPLRGMENKK